jgi:hypothetical protein
VTEVRPPFAVMHVGKRRTARIANKTKLHDRAQYVLILGAEKHVSDPIKSLRALLKIAARQFGSKVIKIREQRDDIAT